MLTYVWIILLASRVYADHPELGPQLCSNNFCVQLSKDEISAEARLCAVIHCSFNVPQTFTPSSLIWFKCRHKCDRHNSDIIYHSRGQRKVQSKFLGRVLPLESDLSQRNCSIIINNLQLSDSGTYFMRLISANNDGFSFSFNTASISVKALQQKPTVLSPALTEGLNASLTCTAPGLCSGSKPRFTWTWTGAGEAPPTVTTTTTEHLTSVNHRHSSTLELSPSAELHGAELSCTVSFNNSSTQDSLRINVTLTPEKIMQVVSRLEVIVAFFAGFILAAVLCCVVIKCHRKKQKKEKKDGDLNNTLEMVKGDEEPEINGHVVEVTDANTEPGELHYANINFSAMTQKARDRENREETKTEYAEIKREVIEEQPEPEEVPEVMAEDLEEAMMDDTKQMDPVEEQKEEEEALYSNVNEILANE